MEYIKSDDFKNLVGDTIFRTLELYGLLKKEFAGHKKMWKRRFDHYRQIYYNSAGIKAHTTAILSGGSSRHELKTEPKLLPLRRSKPLMTISLISTAVISDKEFCRRPQEIRLQ